jgi:hypothetical protein
MRTKVWTHTYDKMSLSKEYLYKETFQLWIDTFHEDGKYRFRDEKHFWALLAYNGKKYGIDRIGQHKVLKKVKKDFINYVRACYRRWIATQRFTAYELISFLDEFAFFPDVKQELQNFVIELYEDQEELARLRNKKREKTLVDIARDGQNVHTTEVVVQTNEKLDVLKAVDVKQKQKTLSEIEAAWVGNDYVDYTKLNDVLEDMRKWGNTESVCSEQDWAYRKSLRGLWAKMKGNPELVKRLWEECLEAMGMCAQGHLSRLANVLVGFEEGVATPVNPKELFQNEISRLAAKDLPHELKEKEAIALMDTYTIPQAERQAWLEALV